MRKNQIKNTVNDLIETYGTRNPYLLASYLDVTIQYGDLGELQGCYMKIWDKKFIYINDRIEDDKLRDTVVAHELAHSIIFSVMVNSFNQTKLKLKLTHSQRSF